jgi:HD-GYP domain-containing protein (c-di-GMP phosphodiesterase class II)
LCRRIEIIEGNFYQTIRMFSNLLEVFNEGLGGHCRRVAELAVNVARRMPAVDEEEYPLVEAAGLLHDIGLIGMPVGVVEKRSTEMTGDERTQYRTHPIQGELILKEIPALAPVSQVVRTHHEQVNGRGFPDGLAGDSIPLLSRIIAGASAYDNLLYKWKVPLTEMADHLYRQRGYQLDPEVVMHLMEINTEHIEEAEKRDDVDVAVQDVAVGMRLARSVRRRNGTLLMPQGVIVNNDILEKLKTYTVLGTIDRTVSVLKSSLER